MFKICQPGRHINNSFNSVYQRIPTNMHNRSIFLRFKWLTVVIDIAKGLGMCTRIHTRRAIVKTNTVHRSFRHIRLKTDKKFNMTTKYYIAYKLMIFITSHPQVLHLLASFSISHLSPPLKQKWTYLPVVNEKTVLHFSFLRKIVL